CPSAHLPAGPSGALQSPDAFLVREDAALVKPEKRRAPLLDLAAPGPCSVRPGRSAQAGRLR
ncbi:hypothetical protein, partial [Thermogemmatispora sp.]|uniref:hypothetical protein n=1 Tax=Thermogemmatispora sp. TaxID=1968838 RepID=UPI00263946EE